jgi:hypothetical protein
MSAPTDVGTSKSVGLKNFDVILVSLHDQSGNKLCMEEKLYYKS